MPRCEPGLTTRRFTPIDRYYRSIKGIFMNIFYDIDVKGTKPCDLDWDSTFEARHECIGKAAYVFHKAKTGNNNGMTTFPIDKPPGIDKLADYDLPNQRALMEAAINSQELGGYLKNWTAPELPGNWADVRFIFGNHLVSFIDKIIVFDLQRYWPVPFSAGYVRE